MLTLFSKGQPKVQGFQYRTLINDEYQQCVTCCSSSSDVEAGTGVSSGQLISR